MGASYQVWQMKAVAHPVLPGLPGTSERACPDFWKTCFWSFAVDFSRRRTSSLANPWHRWYYVARKSKAFSPKVVKKQVHASLLSGSPSRGQRIALDSALQSVRDLIRAAELLTQLTWLYLKHILIDLTLCGKYLWSPTVLLSGRQAQRSRAQAAEKEADVLEFGLWLGKLTFKYWLTETFPRVCNNDPPFVSTWHRYTYKCRLFWRVPLILLYITI